MIKFVVVCHRRPDWSRERFRAYFRDVHGPLAVRMRGVRRYVQNVVQPEQGRDPPWDAVIEFWFADRAGMDAAWASPEGREASADNANCMDLERTRWAVVEEVVAVAD